MRTDKVNYYLDLAEVVGARSTCLRCAYGAVIVKNDEVVSTGYNGAPRGRQNCIDCGFCLREKNNVPHGERYELCRSVHAEANAIISASRSERINSSLYLSGVSSVSGSYLNNIDCCSMCKRLIINAGIKEVCIRISKKEYVHISVDDWIENDESLSLHSGY